MKRRQNVEQTTGPRRSTWIAPIAERSSDAPRRSIQHKNVLSTSEPTSKNPSSSASTDGGSGRGRPEETIETPTTGRRLRRFIAGGSALASVGALVAGTLMPTTSLITADSFAGAIPSQSFFTGGTGDDSGLLNVPAELPTAIATPEIQFNGGTVSVTGLTNTELRYPFDQEMLLTDGFGYRSAPVSGFHDAQDMAAAGGTPIRVVGDGMITEAGWASDGCGFSLKSYRQIVWMALGSVGMSGAHLPEKIY